MACLSGNASVASSCPAEPPVPRAGLAQEEVRHASRLLEGGLRHVELSVPGIHCGGCIRKIEQALAALETVESARVNLTTKRVSVTWRTADGVPPIIPALAKLGYAVHLDEPATGEPDSTMSTLLRALAVAGFAAGNIMLLSVSVWSGADPAMRDLLHAISALIALPALAYSGRVFFHSAAEALRRGRTNMDVPISIGVLLAFALSLYETLAGGEQAYFEASLMLLFFLLIGRTLEHLMREKARQAVSGLARLVPRVVRVERTDGTQETLHLAEVEPGMRMIVPAGERVPVDGRVELGESDLDRAIVTGESVPLAVRPGSLVQAGTLNLAAPLTITATASEQDSFLAEMVRLMEAAEAGRSAYRRVADRAARLYAPLVHIAALASFAGWMIARGDLHQAVVVAVAVLIVTCPCALGLAAPIAQVIAARRLFENGIILKDGAALERLAEVDTVVFDKTGTLTMGSPVLRNDEAVAPRHMALAAAIAAHSKHPLARTLATCAPSGSAPPWRFDRVDEHPGCGLEAVSGTDTFRLGRAEWALGRTSRAAGLSGWTETVLARDGERLAAFHFDDPLRPGARETIDALKERGLAIHLLSGDRLQPVQRLADRLDLASFAADLRPQSKVACLDVLAREGHRVLMVGDGLNDAPALAAAHVSMAPASAADVGRNAAGLVFLGDGLGSVVDALELARRADRLVRENFSLAIAYNVVALPLAASGFVTPLIAAVAMSLSSLTVVANALRLNRARRATGVSRAPEHSDFSFRAAE
jgi:P-type Cu2+ transporter